MAKHRPSTISRARVLQPLVDGALIELHKRAEHGDAQAQAALVKIDGHMQRGESYLHLLLDTMAALYVGDGKEPNMFFISSWGEGVRGVEVSEEAAQEFVQDQLAGNPVLIEDRLRGEVWINVAWADMERDAEGG